MNQVLGESLSVFGISYRFVKNLKIINSKKKYFYQRVSAKVISHQRFLS